MIFMYGKINDLLRSRWD